MYPDSCASVLGSSMKTLTVTVAFCFLVGCESMPIQSDHANERVRYVCYTYDYPAIHVLTLPLPTSDEPTLSFVSVWFQGDLVPAYYERNGLTQLWVFDDALYVKVDADNDAQYWDFRGAEEGEKRSPEAVFECKRRGG